jgi:hypothetical protein
MNSAAAAASAAAGTKQALTWASLTSASTLLNAGMSALVGLEVGRWLRGLAEDSVIGRAGIAALDDGLGLLSYESVIRRDYPVVMGTLYLFTLIGLVTKLISDLCYAWVDPRVKFD